MHSPSTLVSHRPQAAELIGAQALRLWHDQALYKEAGARATDCHQDQPDWPIAETNTIAAWIPLEGSTVASGDDLIVEPPPRPNIDELFPQARGTMPSVSGATPLR